MVLIPYCNWTLNPKSSGLSANIVWAEGTDGELEEIGRFPVRYKTSMGESLFSADYYREMIYAHVDNINLLYVALTRAVESLHIFIPQKGAKGPNVGQLILQNIAPEDGTVRLDGLEGSCSGTEPPKPTNSANSPDRSRIRTGKRKPRTSCSGTTPRRSRSCNCGCRQNATTRKRVGPNSPRATSAS